MAGAAGFDDGRPLVIGSFFGVRQWSRTEEGFLRGVHSMTWQDGENVATCQNGHEVPFSMKPAALAHMKELMEEAKAVTDALTAKYPKGEGMSVEDEVTYSEAWATYNKIRQQLDDPAGKDCGCGFWAYWEFNPHEFHLGEKPVVGIVEGYGKTIPGKRGFRCQKARIVALHCAYEYVREIPSEERKPPPPGSQPGWQSVFSTEYEHGTPAAVARLAQDEEQLAENYPGARVYATLDAMMKSHPPSRGGQEG